jgi:hypothetical protein
MLALARATGSLYSVGRPTFTEKSMRMPAFETDVVVVLCTTMVTVVSVG